MTNLEKAFNCGVWAIKYFRIYLKKPLIEILAKNNDFKKLKTFKDENAKVNDW